MHAIAISDLHLNEWTRNDPKVRTYVQPIKLAERLLQVLDEYNSNELWIAGDTLDKYNPPPQIINLMTEFFMIILKGNPNVNIRIIRGQHDMRYYDDHSIDNSNVSLLTKLDPRIIYAHDQLIELNGTSIYFSNYGRKKINYPPHHVNVWISHLSFGFTPIDNSVADLIVAGDIHNIYDQDNMHSIGTPFQHKSHEYPDGKIGIINLNKDKSTFIRINSDSPDYVFIRMNPIVRRKSINLKDSDTSNIVSTINEHDVIKTVNDLVAKNHLEHIHDMMELNGLPQPINYDYELVSMIVDNVKSFSHIEIDFTKLRGITYISGNTGAGKSTIFYCINTALKGDKGLASNKKLGVGDTDIMRIQLTLIYEGVEYYIDRRSSSMSFKVDGNEIQMSKKETQKELVKRLPFISHIEYFHLKPNSLYFESVDKMNLLKILFNLKVFEYLALKSSRLIVSKEKLHKETDRKIIKKEAELKVYNEDLTNKKSELNNISIDDDKDKLKTIISNIDFYVGYDAIAEKDLKQLNADIEELNAKMVASNSGRPTISKDEASLKLNEINSSISNIDKNNARILLVKTELESAKTHMSNLKSSEIRCPNCNTLISEDKDTLIKSAEESIKRLEDELDSLGKSISKDELNSEKDKYSKYLKWYEDHAKIESDLADALKDRDSTQEKLDTYKVLIDSYKETYNSTDLSQIKTLIEGKLESISRKEQLIKDIKSIEESITAISADKSKLEGELAELSKLLKELVAYNSHFSVLNPNSIPNQVVAKLLHHLNSNNIQFTIDPVSMKIDASIKIFGQWIKYSSASSGQQKYMDLFIIIRITEFMNGVGLVIMDESFNNFDSEYFDDAISMMQDITANHVLVSIHGNFSGYDNLLTVELSDTSSVIK